MASKEIKLDELSHVKLQLAHERLQHATNVLAVRQEAFNTLVAELRAKIEVNGVKFIDMKLDGTVIVDWPETKELKVAEPLVVAAEQHVPEQPTTVEAPSIIYDRKTA